jgi:Ferritin-like
VLSRETRQLFDLIRPEVDPRKQADPKKRAVPKKPRELSWYEYVIMLLQIGASIEHALMVQYLYAAYSVSDRRPAKRWREILLVIAREEMGHLLQVQNILTLLGGPFNLDRGDYPWNVPFDAFPFQLEPLTQGSLACYVYAEMPPGKEDDPELLAIKAVAEEHAKKHVGNGGSGDGSIGHVGTLYDCVIRILGDRKKVPDVCFRDSELGQFSWDEWGRNYKGDPDNLPRANLLIRKVATREDAIIALAELAEQGEGLVAVQMGLGSTDLLQNLSANIPELGKGASHFERFLEIYREYPRPPDDGFSLKVPTNPTTNVLTDHSFAGPTPDDGRTRIESKRSVRWAGLFNLRYRMLLAWLAHALTLVRRDPPSASSHLCGQIVHRVFGEMYNMKAIAEMLVRMPLTDDADDPRRAGPPFEMPYRTPLPPNDRDIWEIHRAALAASRHLCRKLLHEDPNRSTGFEKDPAAIGFLKAMKQADQDADEWIDGILTGPR